MNFYLIMSLLFPTVVNESETVASLVKNELEEKTELRPTRPTESRSALLQSPQCTCVAMNSWKVHFYLDMSFPSEKYTHFIQFDINNTHKCICLCWNHHFIISFPDKYSLYTGFVDHMPYSFLVVRNKVEKVTL